MAEVEQAQAKRLIWNGNFELGETLGKGGFGFVKAGYHVKTKQCFAMKFLVKAAGTRRAIDHQLKQIDTEIQSLRAVDHKNVLKLLAYHMDCQYPNNDGSVLDTILLVLELAPGGELFDVLFYTGKLEANLARTYLHQLIEGLNAIHAAGICHRDLKPQNLLLDSKYQLKITDFGLSKIWDVESQQGKQKIMATEFVGTHGYQAPEVLLKRPYTVRCDTFACGIILFVLLTGYPPFDSATVNDPWYRKLCQEKAKAFWARHRGCGLIGDENMMPECRDIIEKLLAYQPVKRLDCAGAMTHPWYTDGEVYSDEDLYATMKKKHMQTMTEKKKNQQAQEHLQQSFLVRTESLRRLITPFPEVPPARDHLPKATTFVLNNVDYKKPSDSSNAKAVNEHRGDLATVLEVFKGVITEHGGECKQPPRTAGPEFWQANGKVTLTAEEAPPTTTSSSTPVSPQTTTHEVDLYCRIMTKDVGGGERYVCSFHVMTERSEYRKMMVEKLQTALCFAMDVNCDLDGSSSSSPNNNANVEFDHTAEFLELEAQWKKQLDPTLLN